VGRAKSDLLVFTAAGLVKLLTPIPQLAAMMPWTASTPKPSFEPSG